MRIGIDFDGVIVKQPVYPQLDYEFIEGAEQAINELHNNGIQFILNTARYGWYRIPAIWFILKHKLPIKISVFNKKPDADLFIDDKSIFMDEVRWKDIKQNILTRLSNKG